MLNRLVALFSVLLVLLLPLQVKASETSGKVTSLKGEPLHLIPRSLRKEFEKNLAGKTLALDLLRAEHESFKKYHTEVLKIKENQITILNQSLKEEMGSDHSHWWIFGGVAIGILLSLGVFYASVEIAK